MRECCATPIEAIPTLASLPELQGYEDAYKQKVGQFTVDELALLEARRRELAKRGRKAKAEGVR